MRKLLGLALSIVLLSGFIATVQAQDTCPASRLVPWQYGRVTEGSANRMREDASTASRVVDTIPGNKLFFVYETGTCAEGYLWARVAYNNQIGWTPEAMGSDYFVEPVPPPDGALVIPATIGDVAWSPDGKTIALATGSGVYLLDATGANAETVQLTQDATDEVEFNPTAPNILATSTGYGMLRVWNLTEKAALLEEMTGRPDDLALDGNAVGALQFSRDGKLFFAVTHQALNAYDTTTWKIVHSLNDSRVQTAGLSPDGQQLAVAAFYPDPSYITDWSGQRAPLDMGDLSTTVYQVVFSPDGSMLAMDDNQGHVLRRILASGIDFLYTAKFDTDYHLMNGLTFSPDSTLLTIGDYTPFRGVLRLMNAASMDEIGTVIPDRTIMAKRFAFSPDGLKIASVFDNVLLVVNTGDIHN